MCGIISVIGKKASDIDSKTIESMLSCLEKRGPDEQKYVRMQNCILGQTRLSIVDIAGGHQPMRDNTLPITITFNGEIYDYRELKKDLEQKNHKFNTNSDTEVILKAYAEYGKGCLQYLDGMFAFSIYDERTDELFIARDRFGKKPFYYFWHEEMFVAASEIKSLFASGLVKGEINASSLQDYLRLMYVPSHKTIYSNIHTLPPAHAATIKDGKITEWEYWKLEKKELGIAYDQAKSEFKKLFEEAVRKRMVADVEIGSLLSGGIDSTFVSLIAQKYSNTPIKTFSVTYKNSSDESAYARQAAEKIGTDHLEHPIQKIDTAKLEEVMAYFDEPHADSSIVPQFEISALAASKVKVALSGDGADEIFMGYGWYQKYWHIPRWKISKLLLNPFLTYKKIISIFDQSEIESLTNKRIIEDNLEEKNVKHLKDPLWKINITDLMVYLPGQLLSKVDRTSMMNSLEIRCPFLDTKLVEFVYNLPNSFKVSKYQSKILLKDALGDYFPKDFVTRRKQGFGAPVNIWLSEAETKAYVLDKLGAGSHIRNILVGTGIDRLINGYYNKNKPWHYKIWSLLCLELWLRSHYKYHKSK